MAMPDYEVNARQDIQDGISLAGKDYILKAVADKNLTLLNLIREDGVGFTWNDVLWDWDYFSYVSPLYVAIHMQDEDLVSLLRSYGANIDTSCVLQQLARAYDVDGISFLNDYASDHGLTIDWSATAKRSYYVGKSPIEVASALWYNYNDPADEAVTRLDAWQKSCATVSALLDMNVNVPINNLMQNAVWTMNTDLLDLLLDYSDTHNLAIDWNARSPEGYTLLGKAAAYGHVGMAIALIEAGAVISGSDMLHAATLSDKAAFIDDVLTYCSNNSIPVALDEIGTAVGISARGVAEAFGRSDVEAVLASHGANVVITPDAYSIDSLCKAMRYNLTPYVQFVVDYADDNSIVIDWNQTDQYGVYPLAVAENSADPTLPALLISLGADPDLLIPEVDDGDIVDPDGF